MRVVLDARTGAIRDANRIVPGPGNYAGPYGGVYGERAYGPYGPGPYGPDPDDEDDAGPYGPGPYGRPGLPGCLMACRGTPMLRRRHPSCRIRPSARASRRCRGRARRSLRRAKPLTMPNPQRRRRPSLPTPSLPTPSLPTPSLPTPSLPRRSIPSRTPAEPSRNDGSSCGRSRGPGSYAAGDCAGETGQSAFHPHHQ